MGRPRNFDEDSVSISIRVPKSMVDEYRKKIRKFVKRLYDIDKKTKNLVD